VGERDGEDRAHARADRLRPVRVGAAGAERDARRAEGLGGAQHGADVAGIADAVQVHAQRSGGRAPTLLIGGDHACAGAERGHARERGALDLMEVVVAELAAGEPVALHRLASGLRGGREQVLALGQEQAAAGAAALGVQVAHGLQAGIVWGLDLAHVTKKAPSFFRSDAREAVYRLPVPRRLRG
jgi:hypothetical protein